MKNYQSRFNWNVTQSNPYTCPEWNTQAFKVARLFQPHLAMLPQEGSKDIPIDRLKVTAQEYYAETSVVSHCFYQLVQVKGRI